MHIANVHVKHSACSLRLVSSRTKRKVTQIFKDRPRLLRQGLGVFTKVHRERVTFRSPKIRAKTRPRELVRRSYRAELPWESRTRSSRLPARAACYTRGQSSRYSEGVGARELQEGPRVVVAWHRTLLQRMDPTEGIRPTKDSAVNRSPLLPPFIRPRLNVDFSHR